MAHNGIPHFQNERGIPSIQVGDKEFMCIGAKPPLDHPHIFLDMGAENEIVCPYCSTLFKYNPSLKHGAADPADCLYTEIDSTAAA
ncbi:zinc-finger domain-containing protein [Microvirga sp. W0021]|uniref:Zinc-finger domain-containing protein n=1 Tax=Hohaiivirga grylli TaxID=3133970 RepID=A0ABV0BL46_9HYPH